MGESTKCFHIALLQRDVHETPGEAQLFPDNTDEPMWKIQLEKMGCQTQWCFSKKKSLGKFRKIFRILENSQVATKI